MLVESLRKTWGRGLALFKFFWQTNVLSHSQKESQREKWKEKKSCLSIICMKIALKFVEIGSFAMALVRVVFLVLLDMMI